jgi:hypothetical protein
VVTRLCARALSRATLARQFLLERADIPVLDAVAHLGGLQAQEPQEPFVGLWVQGPGYPRQLISLSFDVGSGVRERGQRASQSVQADR